MNVSSKNVGAAIALRGSEPSAAGPKAAWSNADYLTTLEKGGDSCLVPGAFLTPTRLRVKQE